MKKSRVLLILLIVCISLLFSSNVMAAQKLISNLDWTDGHGDAYLKYVNSKNGDTSTSDYKYWLSTKNYRDNEKRAFCIHPGQPMSAWVYYQETDEYFSKEKMARINAALLYGNYHDQYRQTVLWMIADNNKGTLKKGTKDTTKAKELYNYAKSLKWDSKKNKLYTTENPTVSFSDTTLDFTLEGDYYVSNTTTAKVSKSTSVELTGAPSGSYMEIGGSNKGTSTNISSNSSIKVYIPKEAFSGELNIKITLNLSYKTTWYSPAKAYKAVGTSKAGLDWKKYSQELALAGSRGTETKTKKATASGGVTQELGELSVAKRDEYGDYIAGAYFHITGPADFDEYVITEDSPTTFSELEIGEYTITEIDAPTNMILNSTPVNVTVESDGSVTAIITNEYARGSVRLTKYDAENRGNTLGDATLEGAEYNLCAAEDIMEGNTTIYSADEVIAQVTTDENGETSAVTNLPIGQYYYIETQPSEGFLINGDKVYVSVDYEDQYTSVIPESYVEAPENPIFCNIQVHKRLGETDYDAEIDLSGVQFKVTSINHPEQVYYTNISGDDGICRVDRIPYGRYTISECKLNDAGYKVSDFDEFLEINDYTYEYTKVDESKKMKIAVTKQITLREGEATDAKVSGAYFTIYTDANGTKPYVDKNGKTVVIGPTDENGYAISGTMRTGTYYLKETTFPIGIDPDAVIPGEDITYRDKVYVISEDNRTQGSDVITSPITIQNEPNRNHIEILKEVGKTSNTPQFPLDKCEFTATLKSTIGTDHVFSRKCTAETTRDTGYCIIEDLPYGTYVIEETKVSPITLKCANFEIFVQKDKKVKKIPYVPADGNFLPTTLGETEGTTKDYSASYEWVDEAGKLVDVPKVMEIKIRKVDYDRTDVNPVDYTQGDAQLKGAIYQIYRYDPMTDGFTEYVYDITVDHKDSEGYWCAESKELLVGDYMVKEKIQKTEIGKDGKTYNYSYAEGYLVDPNEYYFRQNPEEQTVRKTFHKDVSKEKVIRGSAKVVKYDNQENNSSEDNNSSTEVSSKGAILRLVLNSSIPKDAKLEEGKETDYYMQGTIWYEVTIDGNGYGEFLDKNDDMHTTAVKTCYGDKYYNDKIADVDGKYTYSCTIPYGDYTVIESKESDKSENTSFYIKPVSVDLKKQTQVKYGIETDYTVPMYLKIQKRDRDTGATVGIEGATFKIWDIENKKFISQLSNPDGGFIDEFVTREDGLLPTPEKLLAGEYIIYEVKAPSEYYLEDDLRLPENPKDIGVVGKGGKHVVIDKEAMEVKQNTISNTLDYFYIVDMSDRPLVTKLQIEKTGEMLTSVTSQTTKYGEQYTPVFENRGLPGVTYEIYTAEDIKSPDGKTTYLTNGTKVDTITTDENGIATTKELYPGEYRIVEVVTPEGFLTDTNIPNVTLESSHDELVRVKTTKVSLENVRQKLEFTFEKEFEDVKYATEEEYMPEAVFGVYTNEIVKDYKGNTLLSKDKLVDVITVNKENPHVTSTIDLPKGKYYTKELEVTYPYYVITDEKYFELVHTNHKDEFVVKSLEKAENKYESATIMLVKVSTSGMEELVLKGNQIDKSNLDEQLKTLVNTLNKMPEEEVREYLKGNKVISNATFGIYTDPECTKSLYVKTDDGKYVKAECTTDEDGIIKFEKLPIEKYYLKELSAPNGYQLDKNPIEVELSPLEKNTIVYRALTNDSIVGYLIGKTDIFTGEPVANCIFEISNAEGEVLLHSTTDKEGKGFIPTDIFKNGEKYYLTEIEAPGIYNLNTEPHEFIAEVDSDGKWLAEPIKVENYRKESTVTLTKLDVIDGAPIPNCKFELRSLETDFVVEGVTDEEGIYVFEKIPYGKYTYTELEAPEEYLIDTTPHEITIDAEDIKIVAKDDRAPDTGDIAVIALSVVAIVSVLGIVVVLRRKKITNR